MEFDKTSTPHFDFELLTTLASAIAQCRQIEFTYTAEEAGVRPGGRRAEPVRLIHLQGSWYLYAWDLTCQDWRTFRLDRIGSYSITEAIFDSYNVRKGAVMEHLRRRLFPCPTYEVSLQLNASVSEAATRIRPIDGSLSPIDEQITRYDALVNSYERLALALIVANIDFTVIAPQAFSDHLAQIVERLVRSGSSAAPSEAAS